MCSRTSPATSPTSRATSAPANERWRRGARDPARTRLHAYEDLLADPAQGIRRLLDDCGLDFDAACLAPHAGTRSVRTASAAQVREPLRGDTTRTAAYGPLLDPLRTALGLPPA